MPLEDVLAGLNSNLRKKILLGTEIEYEKQTLPSVGLTRALSGGFPYGRQVLIYGSKSSAKSSFCLEMIGDAQREGKVCAWIDAEMSYDRDWAERLGVDTSSLIVSKARTINEMVDVVTQLMEAGIDIVVVDSITSLLPAVYFKKTGELKELEDTGQMGQESKDFSRAAKMLNYANNNSGSTLLVLISQSRNNLGTFVSQTPTGGNAIKYYSSVVIKLFSSEAEGQAIKKKRKVGNSIIEENVGRKVTWLVQFSKTSPAFVSGEYNFYYKGDVGIDREGEIVDLAVQYGFIKKGDKSSWYEIEGNNIQGADKAAEYLRSHPEVRQRLIDEISSV